MLLLLIILIKKNFSLTASDVSKFLVLITEYSLIRPLIILYSYCKRKQKIYLIQAEFAQKTIFPILKFVIDANTAVYRKLWILSLQCSFNHY